MNTTQKMKVEKGYYFEGNVSKIKLCDIKQKVMTQNVNSCNLLQSTYHDILKICLKISDISLTTFKLFEW